MKKGGFRFVLLLSLVTLGGCAEKAPEISSISPRIGIAGETLSIFGEHFGNERNESYISIAGIPPTGSSYLRWTNDRIDLRIPEFGDFGLVYVHVGRQKSNPALFSNRTAIPEPVQGTDPGTGPRIQSVEPAAGAAGTLVTIKGSGFGSSREGSGVFFSWAAESSPAAPAEARFPDVVEAFETEFGYELWNEREIRVRVPDGAISGGLEVRTPRGNSRPFFFEIAGKPGTKTFRDKRTYTVSYSVDIRVIEASSPNALYLWVPLPAVSSSQRNVRLLSRSREPFVEQYRGTGLFRFNDLAPLSSEGLTLSYLAEVYAVETDIRPQAVKTEGGSPLQNSLLRPSALIPSDDPRIKALAASIIGRERNPYLKAQRIYRWLLAEGGIGREGRTGGVLEAVEEKQADSFQAALLFCALARSAGVPALPVSGVLVDRRQTASRHYWAEFWIEGFGWVPLDPALGAGAAPETFNLREDRADWYFGAVDSRRIAFTRGQAELSRMDPRGRVAVRSRDYALQNLWEEAVGGLESYSSLWSEISITGMYAQ